MLSGYKSNKINENALTKCNKCECLVLSDSSNSKNDECIDPKTLTCNVKCKNYQLCSGDSSEDTGLKPFIISRQSSVKIIVKAQLDHGDSSNEKTSSDSENCQCNSIKTDFSMKHVCFRFCRKKKDSKKDQKDAGTGISKGKMQPQDDAIQTSTVDVPESKDYGQVTHAMEPNIKELLERCCNCNCKKSGGGGGCNTNTIIFPKEKICGGGGLGNIENCIKMEARANSRNMEEILNELCKQRREMREIRELLDVVVRTMREQLRQTQTPNSPNNPKPQDTFEELCRKTCLERKSNTLSMVPSDKGNKPGPKDMQVTPLPPPKTDPVNKEQEKPKKKGLFGWCK